MALNDITIVSKAGLTAVPTRTYLTEAGETAILPGEAVKVGGTGANFGIVALTGDPIDTADRLLGIAAGYSDHTAAANGTVEVFIPMPGVVYRAKATTPANLADTLLYNRVLLTNTGGVTTVDEDKADNKGNGLVIIGYDATEGTVDFMISQGVTAHSNVTV